MNRLDPMGLASKPAWCKHDPCADLKTINTSRGPVAADKSCAPDNCIIWAEHHLDPKLIPKAPLPGKPRTGTPKGEAATAAGGYPTAVWYPKTDGWGGAGHAGIYDPSAKPKGSPTAKCVVSCVEPRMIIEIHSLECPPGSYVPPEY